MVNMSPIGIALWSLALGIVAFLLIVVRQSLYWRGRGVPYIETAPVLGVFASLFFRRTSFAGLTQYLYHACPGSKYFGCMDMNKPVLVIKDPEIVKEVTVKSFDYFVNHRSFVEPDFDPLLSKNIFSLRDDRWREMRTTLSPTFTASKMKYMFQLVGKCAIDFVQYLKEHNEKMEDIDLKDVYTRYTNDVIATAAFGVSVNSLQDRNNEFYLNGKDASSFDGFGKTVKFIGARMLPKTLRFLGLTFLSARADKFFKTLVYETVNKRDREGIVRPDMINLLMQARTSNKHGIEMTTEDIIAQAFIFFLAGFDTSSRLMCFTSHVLAHHPDIQDRLRREVDDILEEDRGIVSYETLSRMKYMDMVLSETLRLYPPSPVTDRVCVKPYELPSWSEDSKSSFVVQPDTAVWIPIFGFHRDPNFFPEPDRFDPERFNDENRVNIQPYTYMPFGLGPRKCIGERFAIMETKILIVQLLRHFNFKPSDKTTKNIEFTKNSFNMAPKGGFWMRLEPRT